MSMANGNATGALKMTVENSSNSNKWLKMEDFPITNGRNGKRNGRGDCDNVAKSIMRRSAS